MYTVINRIPVPASDPSAFEEHFAASMSATLPGVDGLIAAHGSTSHAMPGVVESYETVADLRGDGRDA
jgi:hypothetical protein